MLILLQFFLQLLFWIAQCLSVLTEVFCTTDWTKLPSEHLDTFCTLRHFMHFFFYMTCELIYFQCNSIFMPIFHLKKDRNQDIDDKSVKGDFDKNSCSQQRWSQSHVCSGKTKSTSWIRSAICYGVHRMTWIYIFIEFSKRSSCLLDYGEKINAWRELHTERP